jgi:GNAT superfamily N-acetyltransferase
MAALVRQGKRWSDEMPHPAYLTWCGQRERADHLTCPWRSGGPVMVPPNGSRHSLGEPVPSMEPLVERGMATAHSSARLLSTTIRFRKAGHQCLMLIIKRLLYRPSLSPTGKPTQEPPLLNVRQATIADLSTLVPLFDAYRQFYEQPSDLIGAQRFLSDRFEHQQSTILLAYVGSQAVGFVQLFPSFSSTMLARTFVLNDFFVSFVARGRGVGKALLDAACEYGRTVGAARLSLSTSVTNTIAQSLYERAGWTRDTKFYTYGVALS